MLPICQDFNPKKSKMIEIFFKWSIGKTTDIKCPKVTKIKKIKKMILDREGIPQHQQSLIFRGKQLDDERRLVDYKIEDK